MRTKLLRRTLSAIAIAAVVAGVTAAGLSGGTFAGFQRRATDSLFPSASTSDDVVVVALDDKSIETYGRLPWSRSVHAELARALARDGVRAAVWDVLFSREGDPAEDADLASAFGELPAVVLAAQYRVEPDPDDPNIMKVTGIDSEPTSRFADVPTVGIAHAQTVQDPSDAIIRSLPVVVKAETQDIPSLSLAALQAMTAGEQSPVTVRRGEGVQAAGRFVPTEGRQLLRLNWADGLDSADDDHVISAVDVIEGKVNPDRLRGKTVFVGATAASALDNKQVPVDKSGGLPGVMVHANALNTMLTSSYLAPVSDTETVMWVFIVALAISLAVLFFPVWLSIIVTILIALAYGFTGLLRFDGGHVMNFVYPYAAVVITFIAALAIKYVTETRQRRRVSSLFAQYVPEAVAKQLEESGHLEAHVDGERLDVALFFCDLRGFTSLSATLEPTEVRAMLNQFYELVTEAILEHGGTVLKFVGDEVFAVFGAPLPIENFTQRCLDCAVTIQRRCTRLDRQLESLNIPPVKFGIGMNSGFVVAAHVGGGKRRQYDVVGDTVNLASRLCGQAGKGEIVIPEAMIERLTDPPEMESMGGVALKGLDEPVHLYRITVTPEDEPPTGGPASGTTTEPLVAP